jgi:hypothetical protein
MGGEDEKTFAVAGWVGRIAEGEDKASKDKVRVSACFVFISSSENRV